MSAEECEACVKWAEEKHRYFREEIQNTGDKLSFHHVLLAEKGADIERLTEWLYLAMDEWSSEHRYPDVEVGEWPLFDGVNAWYWKEREARRALSESSRSAPPEKP